MDTQIFDTIQKYVMETANKNPDVNGAIKAFSLNEQTQEITIVMDAEKALEFILKNSDKPELNFLFK